jgi:hypothetical protein
VHVRRLKQRLDVVDRHAAEANLPMHSQCAVAAPNRFEREETCRLRSSFSNSLRNESSSILQRIRKWTALGAEVHDGDVLHGAKLSFELLLPVRHPRQLRGNGSFYIEARHSLRHTPIQAQTRFPLPALRAQRAH